MDGGDRPEDLLGGVGRVHPDDQRGGQVVALIGHFGGGDEPAAERVAPGGDQVAVP
jgi:hypothetical protein